jgi:hypothetical protein
MRTVLDEQTTKGQLLEVPDTTNTYTYRCLDCGYLLAGKWKEPKLKGHRYTQVWFDDPIRKDP